MTSLTPPETFSTARLRLRPPVPDDAQALFERWATDEEVTRYLVWRPHSELADSVDHIERCRAGWEEGSDFVWFIELEGPGELIGSIAARLGGHGVNLGYLLARDAWGEGYMVEALHPVVEWCLAQPSIHRVWATCDVENRASARVLEKAGFEREGILRKWELHPNVGDEPRDAFCYAKVRR